MGKHRTSADESCRTKKRNNVKVFQIEERRCKQVLSLIYHFYSIANTRNRNKDIKREREKELQCCHQAAVFLILRVFDTEKLQNR